MSAYPGFTDGDLERQLALYRKLWRHHQWMGTELQHRGRAVKAELKRIKREMDRRGMGPWSGH